MMEEILLTPAEFSFLSGMSQSRLNNLKQNGELVTIQRVKGAPYRIPASELRKFGLEYIGNGRTQRM